MSVGSSLSKIRLQFLQDPTILRRSPQDHGLDFARGLIERAVPHVEKNRNALREAKEDAITAALLGVMDVFQPSHDANSNGHVDIYVQHALGGDALKGEAKIIDDKGGKPWYVEGLTKLVGKYNTGRENNTLMVAYCRRPNVFTHAREFINHVVQERTADFVAQHPTSRLSLPESQGVFITEHKASGASLMVIHVWVNLYSPTDAALLGSGA